MPGNNNRIALLLFTLFLAAVSLATGVWFYRSQNGLQGLRYLPAFNLPDMSGTMHASSEWENHSLLINFWASWCAPCREEIPLLSAMQDKYRLRAFKVVGIALDNRENARRFGDTTGLDYLSLDGENTGTRLMYDLGNRRGGIPYSVLVDREGRVQSTTLGLLDPDEVDARIAELVK